MTRSLTAAYLQELQAESSEFVHLIEFDTSGGTTRLTTAPQDVDADVGSGVVTWTGIGGAIEVGEVKETQDFASGGMRVSLSGVDQSIISDLLQNEFRGRAFRVWKAHLSDGDVVADPLLLFRGLMNDDFTIEEERRDEEHAPGTVRIETRVVPPLAKLQRTNPVRCTLSSHQDMLERAGFTSSDTISGSIVPVLDDQFFSRLVNQMGETVWWGDHLVQPSTSDYVRHLSGIY